MLLWNTLRLVRSRANSGWLLLSSLKPVPSHIANPSMAGFCLLCLLSLSPYKYLKKVLSELGDGGH